MLNPLSQSLIHWGLHPIASLLRMTFLTTHFSNISRSTYPATTSCIQILYTARDPAGHVVPHPDSFPWSLSDLLGHLEVFLYPTSNPGKLFNMIEYHASRHLCLAVLWFEPQDRPR